MRPLNRPMFKYGGPIKEGIMTGMKDNVNTPKRGMVDGPGSYAGFLIPAAIQAGRFLLRPFGQFVTKQIAKKGVAAGSGAGTIRSGLGKSRVLKPGEKLTEDVTKFQPNKLGTYFAQSPEGRLLTGGAGFAGKAGQSIFKVGKSLAKSPLTLAAGVYYGGGALLPDGTPDPNDPKNQKSGEGRQFTGDEAMVGDPRKPLPDSKPKPDIDKLTKDRIDATKERYYKLMGLDKMKKDSIYDSLIDASQIIQKEGGDLKGAIKSGSLQSQIINAISKNLDDSAKLKRQVDAAVLKGEIEKDIAGAKPGSYLKQAEDYAAMKGVSVSQAYKDLGFDKRGDLNEGVQLYLKTNKVAPAGNDLATLARSYEIDIAGIEDTTTVKNKMKEKGYDEVGYLTEILSKPDAQVAPGNYVINNRVLNVDADKKITSIF